MARKSKQLGTALTAPNTGQPGIEKRKTSSHAAYPTRAQLVMIEKVLAVGNHYQTAARAAGVSWSTFRTWRDRAIDGDPLYRPLIDALERGESEAERLMVGIIAECAKGSTIEREMLTKRIGGTKPTRKGGSKASNHALGWHVTERTNTKDWRAAAWLLEHRFAERYATMRKLQHSGALTHRQVIIVHGEDPSLKLTEWAPKDVEHAEIAPPDLEGDADGEGGEAGSVGGPPAPVEAGGD